MDESSNLLSSGTGESRLAAALAYLPRNVFDQHAAVIDREHFTHKLISCGGGGADVTLEHGYLRTVDAPALRISCSLILRSTVRRKA